MILGDGISSTQRDEEPGERILAAAVGASAGGLKATLELLGHLGEWPGIAIVIVQHSSPDRHSGLIEVLQHATRMPVSSLDGGTRLEINHVYVMPPHSELRLTNGIAQIERGAQDQRLYGSIDRVFEELAEDFGGRSIGVVLSGTGSDGANGIRRIRMLGGFTFAQDASAEHGGMPRGAIATGCVDLVAPPAEIAKQLALLGSPLPVTPSAEAEAPDGTAFRKLLAVATQASGIDFMRYREPTIRRRVQRRMLLSRVKNLSEYVELVETDARETRALVEDILIHVTAFFRDPEVFAALESEVFPQLVEQRRSDQPIRIWVPGCSTGEEAYSLAIALFEFLGQRALDIPIKVFGTDVSTSAIRCARAARYGANVEQEVTPERLQTHFSRRGNIYQVQQTIRDVCVFARHDVTRDPPYSHIDLVSCRNLMIYLSPELQARVLAVLHYALESDGFLLLGTSETTRAASGFASVDAKHKIYRRLPVGPRELFDFRVPLEAHSPPPRGGLARWLDVPQEADRIVLAKFGPAGVVVTEDLVAVQFRGKTAPYLSPAPGPPSFELMRMTREELRLPLRQAIDEARSAQAPAKRLGVPLEGIASPGTIDIHVLPFASGSTRQRFFLILFEEPAGPLERTAHAAPSASAPTPESALTSQLREELASTREYLNGIIGQLEASNEELTAANEEVTSSNEELQTTNEELQSAKEELQATNAELRSINEELAIRNAEATQLSNDLSNVLSSAEIPMLILGRDGRISRFAPAAVRVFGVKDTDIGQPLSTVHESLAIAATEMASEVLVKMRPAERALPDATGHWYQLSARPYVTFENRIAGTVVAAFDIDALEKSAARLAEAQQYAESILETVLECVLVVDSERRVRSANRAFYEKFGLSAPSVVGRHLHEFGPGPWNHAATHRLLDAVTAGETQECRVEFSGVGEPLRVFTLITSRLPGGPHIRVSFIDITERELGQKALQRSEAEFFDVLASAAVGILLTDVTGQIMFANAELAQIFGYDPKELFGKPVELLVPDAARATHVRLRENYFAEPMRRRMGADRELLGRRKDGSDVAIEVTLSPLARSTGRLVVCFVADVTTARQSKRNILLHQQKLQQMAFEASIAEERERRRIAHDLHDRIGQSLAFAEMRLKSARRDDDTNGAKDAAMDEAIALLSRTSEDVRSLTFELSPPILYELGLEAAVSWLAEDLGSRAGITIRVDADGAPKPLDDATAGVLFRAIRELLTNIVKHAHAPSAEVSLRRSGDRLDIHVEDSGIGFDPEALALDTDPSRFGLFSVREQLRRLGGSLRIDSVQRHGTRVSLQLPLGKGDGRGVRDDVTETAGGSHEQRRS